MFIIKTRFLHFATLTCKHGAVISKICKWLNSVNTKETSLEYFSNHRESKYQFGFNGSYIYYFYNYRPGQKHDIAQIDNTL